MSNVKRKDSKNRNLRNGESQRKDGRYVYKYTDIYGKPQFIYSWKLVPTDKTPAGKRDDISLREKEAQIKKDLNDGIDTVGGKMTVCQLYEKKNSQRKNIKRATEKGRQYLMNGPLAPVTRIFIELNTDFRYNQITSRLLPDVRDVGLSRKGLFYQQEPSSRFSMRDHPKPGHLHIGEHRSCHIYIEK